MSLFAGNINDVKQIFCCCCCGGDGSDGCGGGGGGVGCGGGIYLLFLFCFFPSFSFVLGVCLLFLVLEGRGAGKIECFASDHRGPIRCWACDWILSPVNGNVIGSQD